MVMVAVVVMVTRPRRGGTHGRPLVRLRTLHAIPVASRTREIESLSRRAADPDGAWATFAAHSVGRRRRRPETAEEKGGCDGRHEEATGDVRARHC